MENTQDDIKLLKEKIENTRAKLNQMMKGNKEAALNGDIIQLSQNLDELLLEYIKKISK